LDQNIQNVIPFNATITIIQHPRLRKPTSNGEKLSGRKTDRKVDKLTTVKVDEDKNGTCKLCGFNFFMATEIGLPLPFLGLIVPLYTLPKPPSPTFCNLLKPFVESLSSWNEKAIKFCSFSLNNSGMLLGEGNELEDLVPR
jgi:hypothetical protein